MKVNIFDGGTDVKKNNHTKHLHPASITVGSIPELSE